jgi:tetratricopeptide (TPR) repeat protein
MPIPVAFLVTAVVQLPADSVSLHSSLGTLHHPITVSTSAAQHYFDQGLILTYGFNHEEAIRSFRHAIRLDSGCAMCYWGVALALGPNINLPMDSTAHAPAWEAVAAARQRAAGTTEKEQAFIAALATRYAPPPSAGRAALDSAYARSMGDVAQRYPDDADAQALYADAVMNLSPWNYWINGQPRPGIAELVSILERALASQPDHMGLCHFYIHAIEASFQPEKAVPCAERLAALAPGAGHLVHMPAHIYMRVGRYADAITANEHAAHADETFIKDRQPAGPYPVYWAHNLHFLWAAALMDGRSAVAAQAARDIVTKAFPPELARQIPSYEFVYPSVYLGMVRFGKWEELLSERGPPGDLRFAVAMWHYARGRAYVGLNRMEQAHASLQTLQRTLANTPPDFVQGLQKGTDLLLIALHTLGAEIAARRGDITRSLTNLEEAVRIQDQLVYDEPPPWFYPVRQSLGAALLRTRRPVDAERVYREDLQRNPENGWSLFGLAQALRAQGKGEEAAVVDARFQKAWARADVPLAGSVF